MKEFRLINDFPDRVEHQLNKAAAEGFSAVAMASEGGQGLVTVLMEREVKEKKL